MTSRKILFFIAALMIFPMIFFGCSESGASDESVGAQNEIQVKYTAPLVIKVFDVGQGDAILIRTREQTALMDTGDTTETERLKTCLAMENVKKIDKLIITHPHRDHCGSAAEILKSYRVGMVFDNGQTHPARPKFYRNYLKEIADGKIPYKPLRDGDVIDFGGGATFHVLSPTEEMVREGGKKNGRISLNLNSVEGRLVFGEFSMLFTGDGERETEESILNRRPPEDVRSLILKSPHHGASDASIPAYLKVVTPEWVVISCGAKNDYHHPHRTTLRRYKTNGISYYRTDRNGTVTIETDGTQKDGNIYSITTERGEANDETAN